MDILYKAKIENSKGNSLCRLCVDWDEMSNHMMISYSKLAQKEYNTKPTVWGKLCYVWPFDPAKNAIQDDAAEGSDTF